VTWFYLEPCIKKNLENTEKHKFSRFHCMKDKIPFFFLLPILSTNPLLAIQASAILLTEAVSHLKLCPGPRGFLSRSPPKIESHVPGRCSHLFSVSLRIRPEGLEALFVTALPCVSRFDA